MVIALLFLPTALYAQDADENTETVKTGDYSVEWQPSWSVLRSRGIAIDPVTALTVLLVIFFVVGLLAALRLVIATGPHIAAAKEGRHRAVWSRSRGGGISLRHKLVLFAVALSALVVGVEYILLSYMVRRTHMEALLHFQLLQTTFLVALCALALGIIGALVLSSLIVQPIRKLVSHVEAIRDAQDLEELSSEQTRIASRDEIVMLEDTISEMTQGLVNAASSAMDISIGREIQKKFLPLEMDQSGNKLSCGYMDAKNAEFFGYYEGARGISGDYFDYKDIDGRYYAVIKCDIAGKGIPAALLMVQVATMFLNYFKEWEPSSFGIRIEEAVYQINGFIETLGFKGRFAAFTLCIFDSETGDLHFCNAGDNIIHLCDTSEKRFKSITLPTTPAAGALPNSMVEAMGGYQVQTITLDHSDILLLYTDGIEESKRIFRDGSYRGITCTVGNAGETHGNHVAGERGEELGGKRLTDIINAVLRQETYSLHKWHNPEGKQELVFDYSRCSGKIEEIIMALIAAEKMFRCYRHPRATEANRVLVDKKIDAFLKSHFLQYEKYCSRTKECLGNNSYIYYTHLLEDAQYDDLSILGIKRK
jgi:serine phosphatase RsbU (regulator of sigma subunit)